ncbi:hypothetical protein [Accumulibacter sp.]|uniref:hypothetical protein n=1 Tax=Accumulibacter sp. TaxID=2053492 RepID=UPI0025D484AA|nr:hypothetical protein [Accumulibacter sp.]MCM8593862.1 hypothetical protein [Accumulibacter sp.]MCM8626096.1 hypothetical protein [Accumulibacter sp.]MDS4048003.1 hypothetical protein [Accumulibacter sp.]
MACCSGSSFIPAPDAALDPGKRVHFTFGMVLGVDDFRQEHAYLAARDERLLREAIGYGVISGLDVVARADAADATRVEVRVAPGLALLPDGKLVGVAAEQCASLGDWLAGPERRNASGDVSAYVVLRYAEKSSTPVPIPGEPCRDESALQADSRIADSFVLDFTWSAPSSREDDALRSFAAWLRRIPVHSTPAVTPPTVAEFQTAVEQSVGQAIDAGWPATVDPPLAETPPAAAALYAGLLIPHAHYAEYVQAAFDVWVRRLRGRYLAHHGPVPTAEDDAETGLLLAAIDCTLVGGLLSALRGVRLLGRPQLAHLRLLQEWLLTRADDAPRDAHYVLGTSDPRLPEAQDLHAAFAATTRRMARVEIQGDDGLVRPAAIWPETAADYYGPEMSAPIPVGDGGTGQSTDPQPGQLLVGAPPAFVLGNLLGATHAGSGGPVANVRVDVVAQAPDILLDTAQDIDPEASPSFAGLTVGGTLTSETLTVAQTAGIGGLLTAGGGISASAITVAGLDSALIAGDTLGQLVKATRWDGVEANVTSQPTYYYAPGQGHAVRVGDGGTGLTTRPQPLQMLVGRNDAAAPAYVLANLVAGANVSLSLTHQDLPPLPPQPARRIWNLQIDATGGSVALPIDAARGGTGQTTNPQPGQILVGDGGGEFAVGDVSGANGGRNLSVSASASGLSIDTVQDLHAAAEPTFAALRLSQPATTRATHALGWSRDTREVVIDDLPASRGVHLLTTAQRVQQAVRDLPALGTGDQVLVYLNDSAVSAALDEPTVDGQMLIVKIARDAGPLTLGGRIDLGDLALEKGQSITLIGSTRLREWLVVGRI